MRLNTLITTLLICAGLASYSQNYQGNFYFQKFIKEHGNSTALDGLMVKGNTNAIKQLTEEHGGIYRGSASGWHYVRIPVNKMMEFCSSRVLNAINFRGYEGKEMNDTMRVNNRINDIHNGVNLASSLTGAGVIIGFIDTGIDTEHPDFMNPDSSTRIISIWDQTQPNGAGTPVQYGYGIEWDSTEINDGIGSIHQDQWGHGSTVAGAACGNGFAVGRFQGVATDANLVCVESNFNAGNWLATVVDATEYIYTVADNEGLPCVLNASVGEYLGSHDGLDPYALFIDSMVNAKTGRLFVCSGGNSGEWGDYHLHTDVTGDTSFTWFTVNNSSAFGFPAVFFEIWADKSDFNAVQFAMGADNPNPSVSFRGRTNFHTVQPNIGTLWHDTIKNAMGDVIATCQFYAEERDDQYLIQVMMPNPDSANYIYRLESFGNGAFDVWAHSNLGISDMISDPTLVPGFASPNYSRPDSLQTLVSSFQCSPNTITVANYYNDSGYVNVFQDWIDQGGERGLLSPTSSIGPTRTGLMKPELAASGQTTSSCYPIFRLVTVWGGSNEYLLAEGGYHYRNGGTSMSAPVVSGVGAVLLEKCPDLTNQQYQNLLINNTYSDGFTGTLPNYAFGYGKLDGHATVLATEITSSTITVNYDTLSALEGFDFEYEWFLDGNPIPNSNTSQIVATTNGNYHVDIDHYGCSSTSDTLNFQSIWIVEYDSKLVIYPNPSQGEVTIESQKEIENLSVYNSLGAIVRKLEGIKGKKSILLTDLSPGTYFAHITSEGITQVRKISIIR